MHAPMNRLEAAAGSRLPFAEMSLSRSAPAPHHAMGNALPGGTEMLLR